MNKTLLLILNFLGLGFLLYNPVIHSQEYNILLPSTQPNTNGQKVKLVRDYPIRDIGLKVGNIYNVVEEHIAMKQVTPNAKIPLNFISIINDKGEEIVVTAVFFEYET